MRASEFIVEGRTRLSQDTIDLVKLGWDVGDSPAKIAKSLDMNIDRINNILSKYYPDRPNKIKFLPVTQDIIDAVKANRNSGKTAKESADELGITVNQIHTILKRYYPDRDKPQPIDPDTIELVKLYWDDGNTAEQIANSLSLDTKQVKRILFSYYKDRPNKAALVDKNTIELVKAAWDQGKSPTEIASQLNLKNKFVDSILLRFYPDRNNKVVQWSLALSDDDKKKIAADFLDGKTVLALTKEYGVSSAGIVSVIQQQIGNENYKNEIEKRKATPGVRAKDKLSQPQIAKIRDMYANGVTILDIITYFDGVVSPATIERNMLKQPDYAELRAKRDERKRKINTGSVATTKIHRPGVIDPQGYKGPGTIHTWGRFPSSKWGMHKP
jgi:hypothetical protein